MENGTNANHHPWHRRWTARGYFHISHLNKSRNGAQWCCISNGRGLRYWWQRNACKSGKEIGLSAPCFGECSDVRQTRLSEQWRPQSCLDRDPQCIESRQGTIRFCWWFYTRIEYRQIHGCSSTSSSWRTDQKRSHKACLHLPVLVQTKRVWFTYVDHLRSEGRRTPE